MNTEERLERLERELTATRRRSRWLLAFIALAVGLAWTLTSNAPPVQAQGRNRKVVRAREFILENATGRQRASLRTNKYGFAELIMFDKKNVARVHLGMNESGAVAFVLSDGKMNTRLKLFTDEKLGPGLHLYDKRDPAEKLVNADDERKPNYPKHELKGKLKWKAP